MNNLIFSRFQYGVQCTLHKDVFEIPSNSTLFVKLIKSIDNNNKRIVILDLGTGQQGEKQLERYPLLSQLESRYVTLDMGSYKVPDILGDASMLPFIDGAFDL